jgi:hypothetical protein
MSGSYVDLQPDISMCVFRLESVEHCIEITYITHMFAKSLKLEGTGFKLLTEQPTLISFICAFAKTNEKDQ